MAQNRIASIDVLRALTMLLMIWVNDFWSLIDIPKWLQHASATEDYLGFSDIIFPLFLFIVGLSIPYAIAVRKKKGDSNGAIAKHVIIRSISLLIIGVYMVNFESINHDSTSIGKQWWEILMALAVVLIWMNWKRSPLPKKMHIPIQLVGLGILIWLAVIYKGGTNGDVWMKTQWWGILGLIGWAYLLNGLVFLYGKGKLAVIFGLFVLLNILVVLSHSDLLPKLPKHLSFLGVWYGGTVPVFTTGGILATLLFQKLFINKSKSIVSVLTLIGIICICYGLLMRPYWGISKIQGTPAWVGICLGIGFISFAVLYVICDVKKHTKWATIISPAGTATLTCYMIPYFVYPIAILLNIDFPDFLNTGVVGLVGSFVFALLVVLLVGWFQKKGFSLKL
ncbi:MAG: hypothetical protein BM563_01980 [Bacteroidetes bacterium MedPE-SWsnd-G1]|nr:MAG: hypothetical protein BM563_01980 [Bacteroidetes bacterium MedPE-SWsnd-G1]